MNLDRPAIMWTVLLGFLTNRRRMTHQSEKRESENLVLTRQQLGFHTPARTRSSACGVQHPKLHRRHDLRFRAGEAIIYAADIKSASPPYVSKQLGKHL